MFVPAQTIDEVISRLDEIIARCVQTHDRLGYFATLYRNVTVRVKEGIAAGRFENGPLMERFDVVFANRYFEALARYWDGQSPTRSWTVAFQAANRHPPVILQHLLLGMNAHINLDLAIAAVEVAPGPALAGLKRDFYEITALLDEMIDQVEDRIDRVSPWFWMLDRLGGRTDEQICAFAIGEARDLAWRAAQELAALPPAEFQRRVEEHDSLVASLNEIIRSPGFFLNLGLMVIRMRERYPVHAVIEVLRLE
jgi:hypothetical protein